MHSKLLTLLLLPLLAAAHFELEYPKARGFDEDKLTTFPCSGFPVSTARSDWPISGGKISLTMGHDQSLVQVLLGIGSNVGDEFNYVLLPTIQEQGLGSFCITDLQLPKGLNVTDGTNATIQVVTNGDPSGGLYNCADITFRTSVTSTASCVNNTGVKTIPNNSGYQNANQTNLGASSTSSGSTPTPTPSTKGAAGQAAVVQWGLLLTAAVGAAVLL
ncbi:MAG: hypothetical protein M1840_004553 [Geoglossum simile]|nr:MAG: hypothetical protein M1840_004553 [Geoglossum simile]